MITIFIQNYPEKCQPGGDVDYDLDKAYYVQHCESPFVSCGEVWPGQSSDTPQ